MSFEEVIALLQGRKETKAAPGDAETLAARSEGDAKVMRRDPSEPAPGPDSGPEPIPDVDWVRPVEVAVVREITVRAVKAASWTTSRSAIGADEVISVAGESPVRRKLIVRNAGGNDVYIGPERSIEGLRAQGYTLAPGESIELDHTRSVYAASGIGLASSVEAVMTFEEGRVADDA